MRDADPWHGRNVLREYLQARVLEGLQRSGAFTSLAFQGGTALRFLYGLPRYSEDLDFALEGDRERYDLPGWLGAIGQQFRREGYAVKTTLRARTPVHAAWVRFPGILHENGLSAHPEEVLAIKIDVDSNPPRGAGTETRLVRRHVTLRLWHHDPASLLAGKLHAVLRRPFAKGRDVYDLSWYLSDPGVAGAQPGAAQLRAATERRRSAANDRGYLAGRSGETSGRIAVETADGRRHAVSGRVRGDAPARRAAGVAGRRLTRHAAPLRRPGS